MTPSYLTWMDDSRNLTLEVKFCVECDVQLQNTRFLHLHLNK